MKPAAKCWIYLLTGVALLAASGTYVAPINAMRVESKLLASTIQEDANPNHALAVLMAIGRAPLVDYLWLRATKLKEEGRFFDALQLSEWICKLEPRFPSVWAFHAWNMSYNISVTFNSPEERWRWVKNGLSLLRDRGIPANPNAVQLYKELAWIYFHKVADYLDDKHWYYKNEFALMMEEVLGPGDSPDWPGIAAAPTEWKAVAANPQVNRLIGEMQLLGIDLAKPGVMLGLIDQRRAARSATQPAEPPAWWAVLDAPEWAEPIRVVENYWRSKRLREELKLDPKRVRELIDTYGPLDFRLAEAHALYWANAGVRYGRVRAVWLDADKMNTDRIELFCIQNMYRRGKLILSPEAKKGVPPLLMPDTRFIEPMYQAYIEISKHYKASDINTSGLVSENFDTGFKSFIRDAIVRLYQEGETTRAQHYFDLAKMHYPHEDYNHGLEYFVDGMIRGEMKVMTTYQAQNTVVGYIQRGMLLLAYGRSVEGLNYLRLARRVHEAYNKDVREGIKLRPIEEFIAQCLAAAKSQMMPEMYERLARHFDSAAAASQPR